MSNFCAQLYSGHQILGNAAENDLARGVATFLSPPVPEVFFGASAVEGGSALAESIAFSVFCH